MFIVFMCLYHLFQIYIENEICIRFIGYSICNKMSDASIIECGSWIFGTLEANNNGNSILKEYNMHLTVYHLLSNSSIHSVTASLIFVLSNMAKCDEDTRFMLLQSGILFKLKNKLPISVNCDNIFETITDYHTIQIWRNSSVLMRHLVSLNNNEYPYKYHKDLVYLILQIIVQGSLIYSKIQLYDNEYEIKRKMINRIFHNGLRCVCRIFKLHQYMAKKLIYKLDANNGYFMRQLLNYMIFKHEPVRLFALRVVINIIMFDPYYTTTLINYGLLNHIQCNIKFNQMTSIEKELILNLLSVFIKSNSNSLHAIFMDRKINGFVCDSMQSLNNQVCMKGAMLFSDIVYYLVMFYDEKMGKFINNFDNGRYFISFCTLLSNYETIEDDAIDGIIMAIIKNISKACILPLFNHESVVKILNNNNLLNYFEKMNISKGEIVHTQYLEKNGYGDIIFYIRYLISQCIARKHQIK